MKKRSLVLVLFAIIAIFTSCNKEEIHHHKSVTWEGKFSGYSKSGETSKFNVTVVVGYSDQDLNVVPMDHLEISATGTQFVLSQTPDSAILVQALPNTGNQVQETINVIYNYNGHSGTFSQTIDQEAGN